MAIALNALLPDKRVYSPTTDFVKRERTKVEIPAIHGIFLYLLITGIAAFIAGTWLIRRGWFGKRRGQTPHCRRCNYILTGISADRCPECGTLIGPRTTIIGERRPRHRTAIFGCLILLLGVSGTIAPLTPRFREIDWYAYTPTPWVISDLRSKAAELRYKAWFELSDRIESGKFNERFRDELDDATIRLPSGMDPRFPSVMDPITPRAQDYLLDRYSKLSAAHEDALFKLIRSELLVEEKPWGGRRRKKQTLFNAYEAATFVQSLIEKHLLSREREEELVELALTVQASAAHPAGESTLLNFLGDKLLAGELNTSQRQRFISQVDVKVRARPFCLAGANLPLHILIDGKGPDDVRWMTRFRALKPAVDGIPTPSDLDKVLGTGFWQGRGAKIYAPKTGKHTLRIDGQLDIFAPDAIGSDGEDDDAIPILSREVHLSVPFEVLPPVSPPVRWVDDPSLAQTIKSHIHLNSLGSRRSGKQWVLALEVSDLPTDISFEVIARHQGHEYHLSDLTDLKGHSATHGIFQDNPLLNAAVDHVDIILRSAAAPATQTVDVLAPWKGELIYPNVTIETGRD